MVTLNSAALDLVLHQLYVHFPVPGGLVRAVDGVDICFRHQQITAIIGESGCGKSVLGQAILGILPDYVARSGNIFYRSTDILADNTSLPGFYGQQIALIPQNPGDSLNPLRTIGRQFDDILQTAGLNDKTNQRKQQLLTFFGLPDAERVLAAYPHALSGGMLQRVLCAMSICCSPLWLLADEPTKGLDETACGVVYENLQKIKTSQSLGMLIITHDLHLARSICADIAVMYAGQIVEYGPQVLTGPRHPYTQAFLAALPENGFQPLPGLPPLPQDHLPGCRFAPRCPSCQKRCLQEVPPVYDSGTAKVRCFLYA
ncbi:ABC transporter ATP-binding protein [Phascolarctobacterium faecium]|uniref:ABC transporter ATP-binding protein n=1 Tax=Phascolarctobacterium faecium TaxID=33025 RepID=UPI002108F486|nr:ABC transporter ATP-binding protein [Phascolarctobacterium faecium]MCQ5183230.1 ABC transporter ATP-binding protein [Phascolarctobacterium faecium]